MGADADIVFMEYATNDGTGDAALASRSAACIACRATWSSGY